MCVTTAAEESNRAKDNIFLVNQTRTDQAVIPNTCFPNMPHGVKFVMHLPLGLRYYWHFGEMCATTATEE